MLDLVIRNPYDQLPLLYLIVYGERVWIKKKGDLDRFWRCKGDLSVIEIPLATEHMGRKNSSLVSLNHQRPISFGDMDLRYHVDSHVFRD